METYSTYNEGNSIVAKRFIWTQNHKIYKYMTSISRSLYIDKLDEIVNENNNIYHRTIKMKRADVKKWTNTDFNVEKNGKYPKLWIGGHVRISK